MADYLSAIDDVSERSRRLALSHSQLRFDALPDVLDGLARVGGQVGVGNRLADDDGGSVEHKLLLHRPLDLAVGVQSGGAVRIDLLVLVAVGAEELQPEGVEDLLEESRVTPVALVVEGDGMHEERLAVDLRGRLCQHPRRAGAEGLGADVTGVGEHALREEQHAAAGAGGENLGAGFDHRLTATILGFAAFDLDTDSADPGCERGHHRVFDLGSLGELTIAVGHGLAHHDEVVVDDVVGQDKPSSLVEAVFAADDGDGTDEQSRADVGHGLECPARQFGGRRRHVAAGLQLLAFTVPVVATHADEDGKRDGCHDESDRDC